MNPSGVTYHTFVVANPTAGAGLVKKDWPLIERLLRANLSEVDYAFTEGPGHATLLTREALRSGWEMVVAIGGDGTLNEVLNGFYARPDIEATYRQDPDGWIHPLGLLPAPINPDAVLGLIPLGTGGDFRRTLGLMGDPAESISHLRGKATMQVDLGQLGFIDHSGHLASRYFLNISAAGISGLVDQRVNNSWKGLGGRSSFLLGSLRAFAEFRNTEVEIRLDDTTEITQKIQNLVVANGEYFGAGMWVAPGAKIDDGEFQVVITGDVGLSEGIQLLSRLYKGTHLKCRNVSRQNARKIAARPIQPDNRPLLLDIDGEAPGRLPATWHLHPGLIRLKI